MEAIKLKGKIASISYRSVDGWAVFSVRGQTCTGTLPSMCDIGHNVDCEGVWVNGKYGKQLKCKKIAPVAPETNSKSGVIQILSLLPGIGPKKAAAAVNSLGAKMAWKAALECPSCLGVSTIEKAEAIQKKAASLVSGYKASEFLLGAGLTENQANKIIAKYGIDGAITQVRTEPYKLIDDIDGFGFRIVDGIALKAGLTCDSEQRILACIVFCLNDSEKNGGHIWQYGNVLIKIITTELVESAMAQNKPAIKPEYNTIKKLIHRLGTAGKIVIEKNKIYSAGLLRCEKIILKALRSMV